LKKESVVRRPFFLCGDERANCFARVQESKGFSVRAERGGKAPATVGRDSRHLHTLKKESVVRRPFFLCGDERANCFARVQESKGFSVRAERGGKAPATVGRDSRHLHIKQFSPDAKAFGFYCFSEIGGNRTEG